jgi:endonuclease III
MNKKNVDYLPSLRRLFQQYGKKKHPLDYHNMYQLVVMVVLSAQTTDLLVNKIAPALFRQYPSMKHLAAAHPEELYPWIKSVRGFRKKAEWLVKIAQILGDEKNISSSINELIKLPGIGRKSANVIIRESGGTPQGIIVDLHVVRVAPRLGITQETTPEKIETSLMEIIPQKFWSDAGMSLSFLGRERCRPTDPQCAACVMNTVCSYCRANKLA